MLGNDPGGVSFVLGMGVRQGAAVLVVEIVVDKVVVSVVVVVAVLSLSCAHRSLISLSLTVLMQ